MVIKERPILFSGPMVRALLAGQKTVTRRPMKLQPDDDASVTVESYNVSVTNRQGYQEAGPEIFGAWWRDGEIGCKCPYGQPCDRLWVREAWARTKVCQAQGLGEIVVYREGDNRTDYGGPWKPSIHMLRRDSRILLEITDVRVERLQDISEEQARAEGIEHSNALDPAGPCKWRVYGREHTGTNSPVDSFESLWSSINGPHAWNANPWVWVVEFKVITPRAAGAMEQPA